MRAPVAVRVPFCGLPCAPLLIDPGGDPPVVEGGCAVARAAAARVTAAGGPRVGGRPVTIEAAIDRATTILAGARRAHLFGLAWSTVETARRAVRLARRLGGSIDIEASARLQAGIDATQQSGLVGATFGAIRDRADVVLLWRVDPRAEHPDLLPETIEIDGMQRTRRVVLLAPPGAPPDSSGADLEALSALRSFVRRSPAGGAPGGPAPGATAAGAGAPFVAGGSPGGLPVRSLQDAAAALVGARLATVVWDDAATAGPAGTAIATALARLVRDLDERGRAVARPLGAAGNIAGAVSAFLSETGLPRAVRFDRPDGVASGDPFDGAPPAERCDRLLLIGARGSPGGAPPAIVIGPELPEGSAEPEVFIPTAIPGLSGTGTWLRADDVAVPVRGPLPATAPFEEEILDRLADRLAVRPAGAA